MATRGDQSITLTKHNLHKISTSNLMVPPGVIMLWMPPQTAPGCHPVWINGKFLHVVLEWAYSD